MNFCKNQFEFEASASSRLLREASAGLMQRSAGLQPAVSQSSTLQNSRIENSAINMSGPLQPFCRLQIGGTAEYNSALQHDSKRAFSLIEILVTVALLSFIIIGLVAMFSQTRRAFVSSMTQVDVLESGRMAVDMISREIEQLASTSTSGVTNAVNMLVTNNINYPSGLMVQPLADPTDLRTNNVMQLYFVTRNNQQWNAIGYRLSGADYPNGIGTLYRFSTNNISYADTAALYNLPLLFLANDPNSGSGYWSRVIDGVVDFRVNVYNTSGVMITNYNLYPINVTNNYQNGEYWGAQFAGGALPAYVEVELGVLEDRALAHYRALTNLPQPAAWSYLTNHAAQVHIFRQRIPIRDVNPSFYP